MVSLVVNSGVGGTVPSVVISCALEAVPSVVISCALEAVPSVVISVDGGTVPSVVISGDGGTVPSAPVISGALEADPSVVSSSNEVSEVVTFSSIFVSEPVISVCTATIERLSSDSGESSPLSPLE